MQALSKYYKNNNNDLKRIFLKLFVEYSKNKSIQKTIRKGWVWLMLSHLHPITRRKVNPQVKQYKLINKNMFISLLDQDVLQTIYELHSLFPRQFNPQQHMPMH
jgi:hypothetical protein